MEYSKTGLRTAALTDRVTRKAVREFYRPFGARYPAVRDPRLAIGRAAMFSTAALGFLGALSAVLGAVHEVQQAGPDGYDVVPVLIMAAFMLGVGIMGAWFFVRTSIRRGTPTRHYRLARFAADNGMTYEPGPITDKHVTPWADRGTLALTRIMRPTSQRSIEFANYDLRPGAAGTGTSQFGGFCAVRLAERLPHILLRAQGGPGSQVTLLALPDRAQQLSLEGNFDDYFTLYCPEEYERDALYLFTPDVMTRLIDRVRGFDVEIIDDWLFFVNRRRDVVTLDPDAWQGLFDAVAALSDKIGRWERWRDDRLPSVAQVAPGADAAGADAHGVKPSARATRRVAKPGRRLRMNLGANQIIGAIALVSLGVGAVVALFY